jgi:Isochorismatase family
MPHHGSAPRFTRAPVWTQRMSITASFLSAAGCQRLGVNLACCRLQQVLPCEAPYSSVTVADCASSPRMTVITIDAKPQPIAIDAARTALMVIDMQRDFLQPGGFGEALGNDVSLLHAAVAPCQALLAAARARGMLVIHTREGHRPDLSDAPRAKVERGAPGQRIGAAGPMGRILIRGEAGHDIVPALYPQRSEPVIDKGYPFSSTSPLC